MLLGSSRAILYAVDAYLETKGVDLQIEKGDLYSAAFCAIEHTIRSTIDNNQTQRLFCYSVAMRE